MNWVVWGPILATLVTAIIGLIGIIITASKTHHGAMEQANAAMKQADAALRTAQASEKTAEATAAAAIQDAITRATEANDKHWAIYLDAGQKRIEQLEADVSKNAQRIEAAELKAEAAQVRADRSEHLYSIAIIYLRRVIRWI